MVNELGIAAFDASRALSHRTDKTASSPFDSKRDGFVIGEGSVILILEELEHAIARGAKVYAEILSYGATSDAYHVTKLSESAAGLQKAVRRALERADIKCSEVDYINAHATSTPLGDTFEAIAIDRLFHGQHALVSSTKGMTGHECWMAGASEVVYSLIMMRGNFVAPNLNFENPDEFSEKLNIARTTTETDIKTVLSNSFGFGGTNSALIITQ